MRISYDCEEIIEELKSDILEFGENEKCWGIIVKRKIKIPFSEKTKEIELFVNYLLGEEIPTIQEMEGGRAELLTLGELLKIFEAENKII